MPHLYRDDLLAIEAILRDELKIKKLKISTSDFEYDSIDELPKKGFSREFTISAHDPHYVNLSLHGGLATLNIRGEGLEIKGAGLAISEIVKKRQRGLLYHMGIFSPGMTIPLVLIFVYQAGYTNKPIFYVLSIVCLTLGVLVFFMLVRRYSLVEFVEKTDRPNFFIRNKDKLIIGLLFAVVGALVSFLLTKYFTDTQ